MDYVDVPGWLLVLELVAALLVLLLWFVRVWPAAASELRRDLQGHRGFAWMLACATFAAALLRLAARPTVLYGFGQAAAHISKLFHPFGFDARWHAHAGIGAYAFFYLLSLVAGKHLATVWVANALLGALCVPALYLFVRRIADHREAALCAAWLLAVFVPQIRVDASEQLMTLSVLASLLAFVFWLDAYALDDKSRWNVTGVAMAACLCFRPASIWLGAFAMLLPVWLLLGRTRLPWKGVVRAGLIAVTLSGPRLVVGAAAVIQQTEEGLAGGQFHFAWRVVTSWRDVFLDPRYSSPAYGLLAAAGLVALALRRRLRLLTFMLFTLLATVLLYYNEWTLDENDALRFQALSWPLLVALSGIGLAAVGRVFANVRLRVGVYAALLVSAAVWIFVGRRLLWTPLASDRDFTFFSSNLGKVPQRCTLLLQGRLKPSKEAVFNPRWLPDLSARRVLRFPKALVRDRAQCQVVYIGVNCYTYAAADVYGGAQLKAYYARADRQPLYTLVDDFKAKFDRVPPPVPRPECAVLRQRYRLQPIVETSIDDHRGGTRFWRPSGSLRIGFYYLRQRRQGSD